MSRHGSRPLPHDHALPTGAAVMRLIFDNTPLSSHERRSLAALVAVLGETVTETTDGTLAAAFQFALDALSAEGSKH